MTKNLLDLVVTALLSLGGADTLTDRLSVEDVERHAAFRYMGGGSGFTNLGHTRENHRVS